jgi:hypothetical protein
MQYRDLIQFDPIETIVHLKESSNTAKAFKLLDAYVISDRMAQVINDTIIEQLQFNRPADNKGLLIVGNYGTGKSHLMSVISTIAEIENSTDRINHVKVASKAKEIEGRFIVYRTELDGIRLSLQEFVFGELTDYLQSIGVDYEMPNIEKLRSNKDELIKMMAMFEEVHPNKGLLLIVDELLDYLGSRNEQELMLDLNFLRAMGEICRNSRFRFIMGVQEMLFDNPRFSFVAEQLRRVKERTEQAVIVREDIEYVVSRRLLRKDDRQKAIIREHLEPFTPLYGKLSEQLEKYVELFPIHPSYLATFERVTVAEKRVILKTLSLEMSKLMDQVVPQDLPGFISYDSYWPYIEGDKSLKTNPNVKEVMSKATILLDRIDNAFTRPSYKPMARRIVEALSVFRLTTDNIFSKVGVTSEELRDQLFLYTPLPEEDAEFLRGQIEVVLKEILKTVSYQYISVNQENGQYYLDLQKDIDVDSLIEQKSETLSNDRLDQYYYDVLSIQTGYTTETRYKTGYRIWQHELPWYEHKVTRPGYLFFGYPDERSTTQPERDFYIYVLPIFDKKSFKNENRSDEVFFILDTKDANFYRYLKLYAGAKEMVKTSSTSRNLYEEKASNYLKQLTPWFKANMPTAYKMTYKGETKRISEWSISAPAQASVREIIDAAADDCLNGWFNEKYPDYPTFRNIREPITRSSMLTTYIPEALRNIKHPKTKNGITILDGLVLLDENQKLNVRKSGYARWIIDVLESKSEGQVVNASELIDVIETFNKNEEVIRTVKFNLEPEMFAVLLAALVFNGDIVITINGITYDGMKFDELTRLSADQISDFTHIKKPSDLPLAALGELFDMFNIGRGFLQDNGLQHAIVQLNKESKLLLDNVVRLDHDIKDGVPFLEVTLFNKDQVIDFRSELTKLKTFLNDLQIYDTPAKLKNFKFGVEEVIEQKDRIIQTKQLIEQQKRALELSQEAMYLINAQNHLLSSHEWHGKVDGAIEDLILALRNNENCQKERQELKKLREDYYSIYLSLHDKARLNAVQENKKEVLLADNRLDALKKLSTISLLSSQQFDQWLQKINSLVTCWDLTKEKLEHTPICKSCHFRPKDEPYLSQWNLNDLDQELENLLNNWISSLLTTLRDPEVKENIEMLQTDQRQLVIDFIQRQHLNLPINFKFVDAINILLQGIKRVTISITEFEQMMNYGQPMTVEEVKLRFEQMLRQKVGAQPNNNVRVLLNK